MSFPKMKLGECAEIHSGSTPRTNNPDFWDGDITWVTPKDLSKLKSKFISKTESKITQLGFDSCSTKLLPENSVLFSSRAPIGHVAINTIPMCTNQGFKSFVPKADLLDSQYLYYWLKANKEYLQDLGVGATFKEISKTVIANVEIPLPPLSEQRRIASILDQADELRQKRQQAIEKLDQLLQATFIDMFGDPEKNPKKWNKVVLGDICDQKDRVNYGVVQPGNEFEGGVPLIRVGDIDGGILSFHLIKRIDPEIEKDYSRSRIKGNEVLVSCVGSIGTIAKVPNEAIGFNIARAITRVPLQDKRIINFVAECLKTEAIQNYFKKNTRTVSQPTLNVSFVKETEIIFPNEEKILDFCKIVDKVEFQKELLLKALVMQESLFQSLQNQAFNGTL
ncbi:MULTISPECIES: restriction endonuclease subunit S [Acinetobacter]|uniref:Type I restriction endonuclease MjaXP subunit S n=1 Tax=Acinetobacter johnsonii TaxID=40214 RepID=A0AAV3WEQ8_ACIJO|nr:MULTISPECIES: restriction endonuclease subunit S [Acinetobacter]EXS15549.1 type I restriction modification DNA specificity domain protein [Acinetobacter sp. 883425]MDV4279227.1 restriction endonuclease subunit S [Acinetobacter baumannii]WQE01461.1 restriction endonuclease subunit S [Acinetobacter johnsonii]GEK44227.1 type I restriction endonuclease MjaXP subunit S [Acinetobacter johnsonii]